MFVLFGCREVSWTQRIIQVGKGLRAHRVQQLFRGGAGPWQELAVRGNARGPYQCGSQVSLVLLPRWRFPAGCPSPDVPAVTSVPAEAPSSGCRQSGAAPELPWAAWQGSSCGKKTLIKALGKQFVL